MLDQHGLFSHLIIALEENDIHRFRNYFKGLPRTSQQLAITQTHPPTNQIPTYFQCFTPLMFAVKYNKPAFVEFFLKECGANPEQSTYTQSNQTILNAGNLALSLGYFDLFDLCLKFSNPTRLVRQNSNVKLASIHILQRFLHERNSARQLSPSALSTMLSIIKYSDSGDVQKFLQFLSKEVLLEPQQKQYLQGVCLMYPNEFSQERGLCLQDDRLFHDVSRGLKRSRSLVVSSLPRKRSRRVTPVSAVCPNEQNFLIMFLAEFMNLFLEAKLSLDLENFNQSTDEMIKVVLTNMKDVGGMTAAVASLLSSGTEAVGNAKLRSSILFYLRVLLMARGGGGESDDNTEKNQNTEHFYRQMPEGLTSTWSQWARMNRIGVNLARRIYEVEKQSLTALSHDGLKGRVAMMIKKIRKFIASPYCLPIVAGLGAQEIPTLAALLARGYFEPEDPRGFVTRVREKTLRKKMGVVGYYSIGPRDDQTHQMYYYVPRGCLRKKDLKVNFKPLLPNYVLEDATYQVVSEERVVHLMHVTFVHAICSKLKLSKTTTFSKVIRREFARVTENFLLEEIKPTLFFPEINVDMREKLMAEMFAQVDHYSQVTVSVSCFCSQKSRLSIDFNGLRGRWTALVQNSHHFKPYSVQVFKRLSVHLKVPAQYSRYCLIAGGAVTQNNETKTSRGLLAIVNKRDIKTICEKNREIISEAQQHLSCPSIDYTDLASPSPAATFDQDYVRQKISEGKELTFGEEVPGCKKSLEVKGAGPETENHRLGQKPHVLNGRCNPNESFP